MKQINALFVYGTLKPGEVNHHYLVHIKGEWQKAWIRGHLFPQGVGKAAGYPALIVDEEKDKIEGWLLSSEELPFYWAELDAFEGDAYERIEAFVRNYEGEFFRCYVYALDKSEYLS